MTTTTRHTTSPALSHTGSGWAANPLCYDRIILLAGFTLIIPCKRFQWQHILRCKHNLWASVVVAQFAEPEELYILIMDSDIIMRRPYVPEELKVRPGAQLSLQHFRRSQNYALPALDAVPWQLVLKLQGERLCSWKTFAWRWHSMSTSSC